MIELFYSALISVSLYSSLVVTVEDQSFWFEKGNLELQAAIKLKWNTGVAKNVILFIGDGMGPNTVTAARIYKGLENSSLIFESFPHIGLLKTYSANMQVPDSASTATALFSGVKTNHQTVGVDASVSLDDCSASLKKENRVSTITQWAQNAGKDTGFVTTTRVTHATPGALYAHSPNRKWECDSKIPKDLSFCKDIARQLVEDEPGKYFKVIMGGGRQCLKSNITPTAEDPRDLWACSREDGKDLVQLWKQHKEKLGATAAYLTSTEDLTSLDTHKVDYVLGLFANGHMKMDFEREKSPKGMPSLSQMTRSAIEVLMKNKNGFSLVVEGGLIDYAHHRGYARKAIDETIAFEEAIKSSIDLLQQMKLLDSTLIIVTSDHSHSLAISGHPARGNNILGVAQKSRADGIPYTTLLYATGGENNFQYQLKEGKVSRNDPSSADTTSFNYSQQAVVLSDEAHHDGGDVTIYAIGPQAHLFHQVHEQNYVAHVIAFASRIGAYETSASSSLTPFKTIILSLLVMVFYK